MICKWKNAQVQRHSGAARWIDAVLSGLSKIGRWVRGDHSGVLKIWEGGNKKHQTIDVIAVVTHQRAMLYDKINAVVGDTVICKDLALLQKYLLCSNKILEIGFALRLAVKTAQPRKHSLGYFMLVQYMSNCGIPCVRPFSNAWVFCIVGPLESKPSWDCRR